MFRADKIDPGDFSLQYTSSKIDALHLIFRMIDKEPTSELNGHKVLNSNIGTPADTVEHRGEGMRLPSSELSVNEKPLSAPEELADFLQSKLTVDTLNTHFSTLGRQNVAKWFPWRLIHITLSFFNAFEHRRNIFLTDDIFDQYFALVERFSPNLLFRFKKSFPFRSTISLLVTTHMFQWEKLSGLKRGLWLTLSP